MSDPSPAPTPGSPRAGLVLGLVTLLVAALAVAWVVTTDHVRDQVKVQPIGTTCGDRVHRYGAPDGEYDDEDGSVITGFGVTDRELARAKWCEVEVQVSNTGSLGVEVLSRTHGFLNPGPSSGGPIRYRELPGLESTPRKDDDATDATVDDSFDLELGDSVRVTWKVEPRPKACMTQGLFGASLVTFRIRTLVRTLMVDPGLTFSVQSLERHDEDCAD